MTYRPRDPELPAGGGPQAWTRRLEQAAEQAERDLAQGALTPAYTARREEVLDVLNRALASEWSSFLQYWHHSVMASDIHSPEIRDLWKEHAGEEYGHALKLNARIKQIGGVPANDPKLIEQLNPTPFTAGHDLRGMLEADLIGERATIMFYNEVVRFCGFGDNETRSMFEAILLDENEHADELADLLFQYDASTGRQISTLHEAVVQQGPPRREAA